MWLHWLHIYFYIFQPLFYAVLCVTKKWLQTGYTGYNHFLFHSNIGNKKSPKWSILRKTGIQKYLIKSELPSG